MADHDFFSGLQVANISLLSLTFETRPDIAKQEGPRTIGVGLGHDVRLNPDDESHIMLVLNVGVNVDSDEVFEERGFRFEASLSGIFGAEGLDESDERKLFVIVNGLSLLYGEVRSYLNQFSSASPLGTVMLPSVNMLNYLQALESKAGEVDETGETNPEQ